MNEYTFRGSIFAIANFAYFLNRSQLLKERICSSWSKFFPLRVPVDSCLERVLLSRLAKSQKVIHLCENVRKQILRFILS